MRYMRVFLLLLLLGVFIVGANLGCDLFDKDNGNDNEQIEEGLEGGEEQEKGGEEEEGKDEGYSSLGEGVINISFPAPLEEVVDINFYGSHDGTHTEGRDHIAAGVAKDTPIRAPAKGYITWIYSGGGSYHINFEHSDDFYSYLDHLREITPNVSVGNIVEEGETVGYPEQFPYGYAFDFGVASRLVTDGPQNMINTFQKTIEGSFVSPYEYLIPEDRAGIESIYQKMLEEIKTGEHIIPQPCDCKLNNKILIHPDHPGEIFGAWTIDPAEYSGYNETPDDIPDIFAFLPCDTPCHPEFCSAPCFSALDSTGITTGESWEGSFSTNTGVDPAQIDFSPYYVGGKNWLGIYKVEEGAGPEGRAKLTIQWGELRPPSFINPHIYYQRDRCVWDDWWED